MFLHVYVLNTRNGNIVQFHARSNDKNILKNMFLHVYVLNTRNAFTDLKEQKEKYDLH